MMYTSRTIDPSHTLLLIGEFYDDSVLARTPAGEVLRVPRFDIETPVLCCAKCGKATILRQRKHTDKEYVECPDHARHMYETLFAGSHDTQKYNHDARRKMFKQAKKWLGVWQRQFTQRMERQKTKDTPL